MKVSFMKLKLFLISIGLSAALFVLSAQDSKYYFESYSDRDFLPLSSVHCITQDSLGFMWFGTNDGLIRFDGAEFELFQNEVNNPKSLVSNMVSSANYNKKANQLVLGNGYLNLALLNLNEFEVESYALNRAVVDKPIGNTFVRQVENIDSTGYLIATDDLGLLKFDLNLQEWSMVVDTGDIEQWGRDCKCLFNDGDFVWAGFSMGLAKINADLEVIEWYQLPDSVENKSIVSITAKDDTTLMISSGQGLFFFDMLRGTFQPSGIVHRQMHGIIKHVVDNQGNLWVATNAKGLFYVDLRSKHIVHYEAKEENENGLVYNVINDIYFSRIQDILWVGTHKGVSKVDYNSRKFTAYDVGQLSASTIENLYFLYKDSDHGYWFSDVSGLYHKAKDEERFTKQEIIGRDKVPVITGAAPLGNSQDLLISVSGVFRYDSKVGELQDVSQALLGDLGTSWYGFYGVDTDENGVIWMSHRFGIVKFNPKTGENKFYKFPERYRKGTGVVVTDIAVNNNRKEVWVGSKSGYLICYDMVEDKFTFFDSSLNVRPDINVSVAIIELNFDNKNRLWIGSYTGGLLLFNDEKQGYDNRYSKGPLKNSIYSLEKDQEGFLWIATNYGIICFNPDSGDYVIYDKAEGTFCDEFNERANYTGDDGEVILGGVGGFVTFYPEQVKEKKYIPNVVIKSFKVSDAKGGFDAYKAKLVNGEKQIKLRASKYPMQFSVAILNHSLSNKNIIEWQLESYNDAWFEAFVDEPIVFTNLEAGEYLFHVREKTVLNNAKTKHDSVRLILLAPFYLQWWFKLVVAVALLCLVYLIYWYRMMIHRKRSQVLKQMVHQKTRELQVINKQLSESREEVVDKNEELELHRNYLEELVDERTQVMQQALLEAEEANGLKTAFLANLSHEIRTPMNAIIGFSSILVEDDFDVETRRDLLKRILENGEALLSLINDIVDISIIESGKDKVELQEIGVEEFIYTYFNSLFFKNKTSQTTLLLDIDPILSSCSIWTDPNRLKQILNNLLGNAVKFTKQGFVKLKVQKATLRDLPNWVAERHRQEDNSVLLFYVQDTGIGISTENQHAIFKPFWKVNDIDNGVYRGMGLGLNIAQRFVQLLGGNIWVNSVMGEGTEFAFFIPCKKPLSD